MARDNSSNGAPIPITLPTILACLTLLGGVLLATQKLSSDRTVYSSSTPNSEISEQRIDTRLWEDPFARASEVSKPETAKLLGDLNSEIEDRGTNVFRMLAVMIPGGPASEARETRIRSRYAVVTALAESGYAPLNPTHVGMAQVHDWPTTLTLAKQFTRHGSVGYSRGCGASMVYAFEWYEPEYFVKHPVESTNRFPVLLVWLDEDQFNDYPIPRLNHFVSKLAPCNDQGWTNHPMALIGPERSDTLKAMFAHEFDSVPQPASRANSCTNLTRQISLFLANPRAIDEVLVKENDYREDGPRQALLGRLSTFFKEPRNFAATDSDLAHEALDELKLRGVDLTKPDQHHLVLIEGWDDYFGRMLTAAYAAELGVLQHPGLNRATFFKDYHSGRNQGPTNLHTFLYLSGLDGQSLSSGVKEAKPHAIDRPSSHNDESANTGSLRWTPDLNRAEGPAQFDYLGRLAGRIQELNDRLLNDGKGRVSAIGIGGGDIYDTLLILQALRPRFPEAVFFVTDLDARLWDPKEWRWTRNVVAISDYGVSLNAALQRQTAPFRNSEQTAQFAATLSALGKTNLNGITNRFPVRRFEIGRYGPIDISTSDDPTHLHPDVSKHAGIWHWLTREYRFLTVPGCLICGMLVATVLSLNFRRVTSSRSQFLAGPLWLREEDIGGLEGFCELAVRLLASSHEKEGSKQTRPAGIASANDADDMERWLQKLVHERFQQTQNELDKSFEEQRSTGILVEKDLLAPEKLVLSLREATRASEALSSPQDGSNQTPRQRLLLLRAIATELPSATRLLIEEWDREAADRALILSNLTEALRRIINTVDLCEFCMPDVTPLKMDPGKALWRRNRELLAMFLGDFFAQPMCLTEIFGSNRTLHQLKQAPKKMADVLRDPERRAFCRSMMLRVLDAWNARLAGLNEASTPHQEGERKNRESGGRPWVSIPPIRTGAELDQLKKNRDNADQLIQRLLKAPDSGASPGIPGDQAELPNLKLSVKSAQNVSRDLYDLCSLRSHWCVGIGLIAVVVAAFMFYENLRDSTGTLWNLSGASLWPSNWLYLLAVVLGLLFISESYFQLRNTVLVTTRQCRLDLREPEAHEPAAQRPPWRAWSRLRAAFQRVYHPSIEEPLALVKADQAWRSYKEQGRGNFRFWRTLPMVIAYFLLEICVLYLIFGHQYKQSLRAPAGIWSQNLTWIAFILFLFLSFWTIDAALLCRWFILRISSGPTDYSLATRQYFSRQRGHIPYHVLSEWIDVSVIAQITERVGMLIYFPAVLFLLLLIANSSLFYNFPWPPCFYGLAACNFALALASIGILQRAARNARNRSLEALQEKLSELKVAAVVTDVQQQRHDISETENLLEEIRSLKKGAFGGFWRSPALGAFLIPSSGAAVIEIIRYLIN